MVATPLHFIMGCVSTLNFSAECDKVAKFIGTFQFARIVPIV